MIGQGISVEKARLTLTLYRNPSASKLMAGVLILFSFLLHLILIALGWPTTNSDEGTMGLMALHIAYQGTHPTFFYGQNYMGSWEALIGAGIFHILGPSLFALRLGTVLMFTLFLICLYFLARMLFSHTWAFISLLLVGTGSGFMMTQEIKAIGGYAETLFFCSLLFLCATWLTLTYQPDMPRQVRLRRSLVYLLWGLAAGLGLWTDMLIVPPILASGLLLLAGCRREPFRLLPLLCLLVGLCAGASPLIYYNLHAAPGQDSLTVLRGLDGTSALLYTPKALLQEISNTLQISLPLMTGEPFCPVSEIAFLGPTSTHTLTCTVVRSSWSAVYLLLFAIACVLAGRRVWLFWRQRKYQPGQQIEFKRQLARLALLLSTALSLLFYTFSNGPLSGPGLHSRYLICLLVATPTIFWPLWQGLQNAQPRKIIWLLSAACLLCFCGLSLLGSVLAFTQVPAAVTLNQQDAALINTLEHLSVRHIYTDYWTCDKIAFESDEHIVCAVISPELQVSRHYSRYTAYIHEVSSDPQAAYVFPTTPDQFTPGPDYASINNPALPLSLLPACFRTTYTRVIIAGYVLFIHKNVAIHHPGPQTHLSSSGHTGNVFCAFLA